MFSVSLFLSVNRKVVIKLICFLSEFEIILSVHFHDNDIHIFLDALKCLDLAFLNSL